MYVYINWNTPQDRVLNGNFIVGIRNYRYVYTAIYEYKL